MREKRALEKKTVVFPKIHSNKIICKYAAGWNYLSVKVYDQIKLFQSATSQIKTFTSMLQVEIIYPTRYMIK